MAINTITGEILGDYVLHRLRVGCTLTSPAGVSVYFQPGDEADELLDQWDAIESEHLEKDWPIIAYIAFSDYFPEAPA